MACHLDITPPGVSPGRCLDDVGGRRVDEHEAGGVDHRTEGHHYALTSGSIL